MFYFVPFNIYCMDIGIITGMVNSDVPKKDNKDLKG